MELVMNHGFVFEGVRVEEPTLDESGRFSVEPVSYYGAAFTEKAEKCGCSSCESWRLTGIWAHTEGEGS
jgi:hypothetical protein